MATFEDAQHDHCLLHLGRITANVICSILTAIILSV